MLWHCTVSQLSEPMGPWRGRCCGDRHMGFQLRVGKSLSGAGRPSPSRGRARWPGTELRPRFCSGKRPLACGGLGDQGNELQALRPAQIFSTHRSHGSHIDRPKSQNTMGITARQRYCSHCLASMVISTLRWTHLANDASGGNSKACGVGDPVCRVHAGRR